MGIIREKRRSLVINNRKKLKAALLAFAFMTVSPTTATDALDGLDFRDRINGSHKPTSYEDLSKEYLKNEYETYESFALHKPSGVDVIVPTVVSKSSFEYPNGSKVNILSNDVVERIDEEGNKTTYEPNLYTKLYYENSGLVVLESEIRGNVDSGGVYRIILPSGEMIEKKYYPEFFGLYKIVSSNGEEVFYTGAYNGILDGITGEHLSKKTFAWTDEDGMEGTKTYVSEEVIGSYGPHFGTEFGIDWYNSGGNLVRTCNFEGDESNRYTGEIRPLTKGVNECVWNDGTVVRYETVDNIILSCTYPNGRTLEISHNEIVVKEGNEVIGNIPLSQPVESTPTNNFIISDDGYIYLIDGEYYFKVDMALTSVTGVKHYDGEDIYTTVLSTGKGID